MKRKLIVGNWKMNGTVEETLMMVMELRHKLGSACPADVVIAPPFTSLYSAHVALQEKEPALIELAAQNMHWETTGAYTGEISGLFLKEIGCRYVILGHSERRRYFGEVDEALNQKIQAALAHELIPIFCIGETREERKAKKTEEVLAGQIKKGLLEIPMADVKDLVIAYEPVWAIGTGDTASIHEIEETLHFIRNFLAKMYDAPTANSAHLLYGGSVNPEGSGAILKAKEVDGLLVGGASLITESFLKIIKSNEE